MPGKTSVQNGKHLHTSLNDNSNVPTSTQYPCRICWRNRFSVWRMAKAIFWCASPIFGVQLLYKKKYSTGQQPLYNHRFSGHFQRIPVLNPTVLGLIGLWSKSMTQAAAILFWDTLGHWHGLATFQLRSATHGLVVAKQSGMNSINWCFFLIVLDLFSNHQHFRKYLPASEVPKCYNPTISGHFN